MKRISHYFLFFLTLYILFKDEKKLTAQTPGEWTWMHGDSTNNSPGVFGIQGIPDPANKPPALYEPCEWTDNDGNFWLFGGQNTSGVNYAQFYTALWKFDPVTNQWTWMKGPSATMQSGVYGTQGVPSSANYPGSRAWGACTWTDLNGNLWLFGGYGFDYGTGEEGTLNDLWKYDIATNQWTWMRGENTIYSGGYYGTMGVPSPLNDPPPRHETSCTWTDKFGNLWMYGGLPCRADLWKYDISINQWTWMNGASDTANPIPSAAYGTQGVFAPGNTPGNRNVYASWNDMDGNLLLMGGHTGCNSGGIGDGYKNDVWKYDIALNQWAWVNGSTTVGDPGNYETLCMGGASINPSARTENRAAVGDRCGNLWMFGGNNAFVGADTSYNLNDLWHYNSSLNEWKWISGSSLPNQPPVFGIKGISAYANAPGAKQGSVAWIDKQGCFWLFGGADVNGHYYGDLFRYVPYENCAICSHIIAENTCLGDSTLFSLADTSGVDSVYWDFGEPSSASDNYSTLLFPFHAYSSADTFTVSALIYSSGTTDTLSLVLTLIPVASVNLGPDSIFCIDSLILNTGNSGFLYLWSTGETTQSISADSSGIYWVKVYQGNCAVFDSIELTLNPNSPFPGTDTHTCTFPATLDAGNMGCTYSWSNGETTQTIQAFVSGTYWVIISNTACSITDTVTVSSGFTPYDNLGPDTTVLCGSVITLDAGNPGMEYEWYNTGWAFLGTSQTIIISPPGYYRVVIYDPSHTCSDTFAIYAGTIGLPPDNMGPDTTLCGDSLVLDAGSGGGYYYWYPGGETTQLITVFTSGNYSVEVFDSNLDCYMSYDINVAFAPELSVNLGSDTTLCFGTSLMLDAGYPGSVYLWSTGDTTQTIVINTSGTYYVQVGNNSCLGSDSVQVTLNPELSVDIGNDTLICSDSITLDAGNPGSAFLWSTGAVTQSILVSNAGIYIVAVTDAYGCATMDTVVVTSVPGPVLTTLAIPACGTEMGSASVTATGATSPYTYLWNTGATTSLIDNLQPQTYIVTVTDVLGCSDTISAIVLQYSPPIIYTTNDTMVNSGTVVQLEASGGSSYLWSTGETTPVITVIPSVTTVYAVTVTDNKGCSDTKEIKVSVNEVNISIPTVFTPNGDGKNDHIFVHGYGIKEFRLVIYNRWGEIVFDTNDKAAYWDGSHNGKQLNAAVFVYQLTATFTDETKFNEKGNITLIR